MLQSCSFGIRSYAIRSKRSRWWELRLVVDCIVGIGDSIAYGDDVGEIASLGMVTYAVDDARAISRTGIAVKCWTRCSGMPFELLAPWLCEASVIPLAFSVGHGFAASLIDAV